MPGYLAGLKAWRLEHWEVARDRFERAWRAARGSASTRAAAAFWAARAHARLADRHAYSAWMKHAAQEPRTFYGILAGRMLSTETLNAETLDLKLLGIESGLDWGPETLGEADLEALGALPGGRRLFALLQVGEPELAEAELRRLWFGAKDDLSLARALRLVARQAGLTDPAIQLSAVQQDFSASRRDSAAGIVPGPAPGHIPGHIPGLKLSPRNGFRVDPALVYALTRVESNFDASAVSAAGARGLMQIMPMTAGYIAGDPSIAESTSRLHDPALNLDLGQRYVLYLADADMVGGDLIRVLASYNSGPGNLARWTVGIEDGGDPLLFIESIPISETRNFVQQVLAYTWVYAQRLRLPAPSLDELAAGAFPRFTKLDGSRTLPVTSAY